MIPINKNNTFAEQHYRILKPILTKKISKTLRSGFVGRNPNRLYISPNVRRFLEDLENEESLERLILCPPEELPNLIRGIGRIYPNFITNNHEDNSALRNIFIANCYDNKLDKHEFVKGINIDSCPYCNRNYIYYLSKSNKIKPEIDHFFPKDKYPFIGVSFFNLIPSCQTCNGFGGKENKDPLVEDMINPYLLSQDSFKFTYKINSINVINPLLDKSSVSVKLKNKIAGNSSIFRLDDLYNLHTDHVLELVVKSKVKYSTEYRQQLNKYQGISFSDEEINRLILGNYSNENDLHKRPLSKLYRDIALELGMIKKK